jgi:hypothetical protein
MAQRRMFPKDPPSITFTKNHHQLVHGDLLPGREAAIVYDAERLPHERSQDHGKKAWTIRCFYRFVENGTVSSIDLWSETGKILHKISNEPGEGTMMLGRISIPDDADHLTVWFLNTGKSGAEYWDSNFGRNYIFRFVLEDIDITDVGVKHDPKKPISNFHVEVDTSAEVDDITVLYRIMNAPHGPKDQDIPLPLDMTGTSGSTRKRRWSGTTPVPEGAVVRFTVAYNSYGNPHADTNSGKGYLTWEGAQANVEAGVI